MSRFNDMMAGVLAFYYELTGSSFGFAIILLTLTVMLVTTPLTIKGTRSMMAMQRMQPEMKKLQDKYKDDRERLNTELMAFYKENNISPVTGCLPLFLQFPVFLILFEILRGLTRRLPDLGVGAGWLGGTTLVAAPLAEVPAALAVRPFDPAYVDPTSVLAQDLHGSVSMDWFGLDLSRSALDVVKSDLVEAIPYVSLIVVVALTGWYQQKQTQSRSSAEPNPQQQMMARMMLVFLPVISFSLPAGLTIYFVTSNLFRVGQQAYINRTLPDFPQGTGKALAAAGAVHRGPKSASSNEKSVKTSSGGSAKNSVSKSAKPSSAKKRYTSDPKAKTSTPKQIQPRARTKKKR